MNFSKEEERDILGIDNFMYMGDSTLMVDVRHSSETSTTYNSKAK